MTKPGLLSPTRIHYADSLDETGPPDPPTFDHHT
jgi:hypothetical protein